MNFGSYFFSDKIALSMYGAKPVSREEAPRLYAILDSCVPAAACRCPRSTSFQRIRPTRLPRDAIRSMHRSRSPGALRLLDENELQGVLAHELAHVKNRDILISSIAATIAGIIMWVSNMARFAMIFGGGSRDRDEGGGGALGGLVTSSSPRLPRC